MRRKLHSIPVLSVLSPLLLFWLFQVPLLFWTSGGYRQEDLNLPRPVTLACVSESSVLCLLSSAVPCPMLWAVARSVWNTAAQNAELSVCHAPRSTKTSQPAPVPLLSVPVQGPVSFPALLDLMVAS